MAISINSDSTVPQPMELLEEYIQIQTENQSVSGAQQRNRIGQKKQATLTYSFLSVAEYQNLLAKFTTGSGVFYNNNLSNKPGGIFTISGLPYFTESPYVQGASLYAPFQVRIREQ